MIWGSADVGATLGGNSQWLMGFNEPDGQSNLPPDQAAQLWRQIEQTYPTRKLVAPAPSHLHPEWIVQFRDVYHARYGSWPRLDALAFHCYLTSAECVELGQRFVAWARAWGVPEVWCTEFAFLPAWTPNAEVETRRFMAWLENESLITRYAPFVSYTQPGVWWWPWTEPGTNPSLFEADLTTLTAIGQWYARGRQ